MSERITAVTGFSRCGTTLMMRMLNCGGMAVLADNAASYEDERVNYLPRQSAWLASAKGKAVKLLEPMKMQPPREFAYDFIWMHRNPVEQARSQLKFLREVAGLPVSDKEIPGMADSIIRDTPVALETLRGYPGARVLVVHFERLLRLPCQIGWDVEQFLNRGLDVAAMKREVRSRAATCYPGLLELEFLDREFATTDNLQPST